MSRNVVDGKPLLPEHGMGATANGDGTARRSKAEKDGTADSRYRRGTRSYIMSKIRGKDTSIEGMVRRDLFARGLRFRKNDRRYPGHPDIVLPRWRTVVFVNGCFWHMHEGCKGCTIPKSNVEFWTAKLNRNKDRDARQHAELEAMGWHVIVVWECELRKAEREARLDRLYSQIVGEWAENSEDGSPTLEQYP